MTTITGTAILRTAAATAVTVIAALALAGPGSAAPPPKVVDQYVEVANCAQPSGQLCPGIPSAVFDPERPFIKVQFTANAGHCSDIIAHIIVEGQERGSIVVGPGQTGVVDNIPLRHERQHYIGVQAEGITGGCNEGRLASWGGNLRIEEFGDPDGPGGMLPPPP